MKMAPSISYTIFEDTTEKSANPSSIFLSPFPFNCFSPLSVPYHDYTRQKTDPKLRSPSPMSTSADDAFGCPARDDHSKATIDFDPTNGVRIPPYEGSFVGFDDTTLSSQSTGTDAPLASDVDFLKALDELEFELEENEVHYDTPADIELEKLADCQSECRSADPKSFVSICDTNNTSSSDSPRCNSYNCHQVFPGDGDLSVDVDMESIYEKIDKEIFMRRLGLQRVSPVLERRANRKRKLDDDSSFLQQSNTPFSSVQCVSEPLATSNVTDAATSSLQNTLAGIGGFRSRKRKRPTTDDSPCFPVTGNAASPTHIVPYKLCFWSSVDWQRSVLYSTAKSNTCTVQTSPSTACLNSNRMAQMRNGICRDRASSNYNSQRSPTFPFQSNGVDVVDNFLSGSSTLDEFEFQFLDRGELDEDTQDLLNWLDGHDNAVCDEPSACQGNESDDDFSPSCCDQSEDLKSQPSPAVSNLSISSNERTWFDADSFEDLEAYVTDDADEVPSPNQTISKSNNVNVSPICSTLTGFCDVVKQDNFKSHSTGSDDAFHNMTACGNNRLSKRCSSAVEQSRILPSVTDPLLRDRSYSDSSPVQTACSPDHTSSSMDLLELFSDDHSSMFLSETNLCVTSGYF